MSRLKFALIELNREDGPSYKEVGNIEEEEKNNILLFALPTGEARDGSFKLIRLRDHFFISYINFDGVKGNAAVIGFDVSDVQFNPFLLLDTLKRMVADDKIPEDLDISELASTHIEEPYSRDLKGGEYIMASMLLLERVIVVGDHGDILEFLKTIYEASPVVGIPQLSCVTLVKSISDQIVIQGVEPSEDIYKQLDEAKLDSTIVILDEEQAFGIKSSPFTKKIAKLYNKGEFSKSRKLVSDFIQLSTGSRIESAADFADKEDMDKADAKLLKTFQQRIRDIQKEREKSIYYKGVD